MRGIAVPARLVSSLVGCVRVLLRLLGLVLLPRGLQGLARRLEARGSRRAVDRHRPGLQSEI